MASHLHDGHPSGINPALDLDSQQRFVAILLGQDEREIPSGVAPSTAALLRDALLTGAWDYLDARSARLTAAYFATPATFTSLAQAGDLSKERVRQLIGSGLRSLWEHLPADLRARHRWDAVRQSKDQGARRREVATALWQDPAYRAKVTAAVAQCRQSPAAQARHRAAMKAAWQDPRKRARFVEKSKTALQDPGVRARHSAATRAALQDERKRARNSELRTREWQDPATRARRQEAIKAAWQDPERRARQSARVRQAWQESRKRNAGMRTNQDPPA